MTKSWYILFPLVFSSMTVFSEENFGDFLDSLKGKFDQNAKPRPTFTLDSNFRFRDPNGVMWTTPSGTEVDGASIPQALWSLIGGPFEGSYINASVIHDYFCKTKEKTSHDTHRNFYYGMRATNVPEWKAKLMYWAVETFGPSWTLERKVVFKQSCLNTSTESSTCTSVPSIEVVAVSADPIDLSDPVIFAAAVNKTNAVARTLLTSNGKYLDTTDVGIVSATEKNITNNSMKYREIFKEKDFISSYANLGVLSQPNGKDIFKVKPWPNKKIPTMNDAIVLTNENIPKIENQEPFKLGPNSQSLIQGRVNFKTLRSTSTLATKE
ncbi:DUF1353 domain-containing protein [Aeromonas rivipollensis]|uniref:DUF1353 domain-containing protein n=1 Tax=Aeromonas rivipollensis TaxID=948519 RepID=UPI00372D3D02